MNLDDFDIQDFLTDESFYQSVKDPNCEEALFWKTWLNDNPDKKKIADQAKTILLSIDFKDKSFNQTEINQLWRNIKQETIDEDQARISSNGKKLVFWRYLKVAAVLLPFLVASVLFLFFRNTKNEQETRYSETIEKYNPKGQKLTVFLSDGSRIKLNAESRLVYNKPFDEQERVVMLEGEAFFEVTPDKERPFIVKTGDVSTRVLGTSFNIKAYPEENKIDIAVKSGKVSVERTRQKSTTQHNKAIQLAPSEMARFMKEDARISVTNYDPKEVLSWSEGTLYFNDASMEEFVSRIERWYGVDIIVQRKTPIKKGIVGEFKDQSLEEILLGIHEASEFEYEFIGEKLLIK